LADCPYSFGGYTDELPERCPCVAPFTQLLLGPQSGDTTRHEHRGVKALSLGGGFMRQSS